MVNVFANNIRIPKVKMVKDSPNTIICRGLKEEFFGISTLDVGNDNILCEHPQDDMVKINIKMEGKEYKDVHFKLIVDQDSPPALFINENQLASVPFQPVAKKDTLEIITESLPKNTGLVSKELLQTDFEFQEKIKEKQKIIENLNREIEELSQTKNSKILTEEKNVEENIKHAIEEGIEIYRQKLLGDFLQINERQEEKIKNTMDSMESLGNKIQEDIEKYKQKLLGDFLEINNQQTRLKDDLIQKTIESLQESFNEKYLESVADIRKTNKEEVKNYTENFLENLSKSLEDNRVKDLSGLQELVHETIKNDLFLVTGELQERFNKQVDEKKNELYEKLEAYKETIRNEISQIFESQEERIKIESNDNLEKKINEAKNILVAKYVEDIEKNNNELRKELIEQISVVEEKINRKQSEDIKFDSNALVAEAARMLIKEDAEAKNELKKVKDQLLKDLQKAAETYATNANKRMMRYAEMMSGGGSNAMQFANGGTMNGNLNVTGKYLSAGTDILTLFGSGGRDDVDTTVITNSANWNSAYDIATSYRATSGDFVTETEFGNYQTSVAASTATLLRTTIYQGASGNWQSTYTLVQAGSSNWYAASASAKNYTHQNFLPLSGGTISGNLYVQSSLYVLGSAVYINTQDLNVKDAIIYIADNNRTDMLDLGIMASWTTGSYPIGYQHGGLIRRQDNKIWTLFSGSTAEPMSGININWNQTGILLEPLSAKFYGDIYGNRNVYGSLSASGTINGSNLNINNWNKAYDIATTYSTTSGSFALSSHGPTHLNLAKSYFSGSILILATYASFSGSLPNTDSFTIVADNIGSNGNSVYLYFGGSTDIYTAISNWNADNPDNTITLTSGDDGQIPEDGSEVILSGGVDGGNVSYYILADNNGSAGNNITLTFDGTSSVNTVLATWNSDHPTNTATIITGDGSSIPDSSEVVTLSHGADGIDPVFDQNLNTVDNVKFKSVLVNLTDADSNSPNNKLQSTSLTILGTDPGGGQVPTTVIKGGVFMGKSDGSIGMLTNTNNSWGPNVFEFAGVNYNISSYNNFYFTAGYYPQLWLSTSGNVGIHTAYPNERLTVVGTISTSNNGNSILWNEAYNAGTAYQSNSASYATNTTLNSVSSLLTPLTLTNTLTGQLLLTSTYQNASGNFILDGGNTKATNITIGTNDNFNLNFETANVTRMTVTSAGNIGIGTTVPNERLTVVGNISSTGVIYASGGNSNQWINSKTLSQFTAIDNQPLSANFATLDTRISIAVLDFDDTTTESACFVGVIPDGTNLTSGLQARLIWAATVATAGSVKWGTQFMNLNTPLTADSFDTSAFGITTTSSTSGLPSTTTVTCTALDGMTAGSFYRMKVYRDSADTVNDTMAGDAELIAVEVRSVV